MARHHTQPGVRRIGLPSRTLRAVTHTIDCPLCDAPASEPCRVLFGDRRGQRCGPHGARIQRWMDHDMPQGGEDELR